MILFNPYEVKSKLEGAAPILLIALFALALEEAKEQESSKPLTDLIGDLLGPLFH